MTILCYHAVQDEWVSPLAVSPADFAQQMEWLARHRRVLSLTQAVSRLDRSGRLPRGEVVLTFDDGFASVREHALPVLRRYGLPATVFLVAETLTPSGRAVDWVDTPPPYPLQTLTAPDVREMQADGVEFASHSYSHFDLTTLTGNECELDLRRSRQLLADVLGHDVLFLAYPRGRHNETVRLAAARAGYSHSFALPQQREPVGPHSLPRVGVFQNNTLRTFRVKCARGYLPVRTSPVFPAMRDVAARARRRLGS